MPVYHEKDSLVYVDMTSWVELKLVFMFEGSLHLNDGIYTSALIAPKPILFAREMI